MSDTPMTARFALNEIQDIAKAVGMDFTAASDLNKIVTILEVATKREQERCARIAEGFPRNRAWVPGSLYDTLRRETAADIRKQPAD